jgi:tetratricopeptide (TPR) repeat protein
MRERCAFFIFSVYLLALMTSACGQQSAEGWLSIQGPNTAQSLIDKGIILYNQGRSDEAIKCIDEAIRLDQDYAYAWNIKGAILRNQGAALDNPEISLDGQDKYDEAMRCFDEAIRLDPNLTQAWIDKGIALLGQGRALTRIGLDGNSVYDEAIKCFDEAIRLNPDNAVVWNQKGAALYRMGRDTEAETAFSRAKELEDKGIPSIL